jgi:AraC-like DNA-binding protein
MQKMLKRGICMDETYESRGYLLEDFRLFHLKDDRGANTDYHYHEFYKLTFFLSGNGSYTVEGRLYQLLPGDIVLVGSRCVHKPQLDAGHIYERIILYISPEFLRVNSEEDYALESVFSGSRGHVLRPAEEFKRRMLMLFSQLETEMGGQSPGRSILAKSVLLRLLVEIGREWNKTETQLPGPVVPKDEKILEILRYLEHNLSEDLSIDRLAARFYISKYHMMRRFRAETGTSIHACLSDKRLLLARELIQTGVSATEACFQCGFRSYSAFSRAYGKLFGVTPTGRMTMPPASAESAE